MAKQSNHPELSVMQSSPTEGSTFDLIQSESIKSVLIEESTAITHQSSHRIDKTSPKIVLATLNARFFHTSFGLRYLYANLQELQQFCEIKEFIIQTRALDIVEQILASKPDIVGFGVYIWNIVETTDVVNLLKVTYQTHLNLRT